MASQVFLQTLKNVHRAELCVGRACCIHNPSDHPLRDAPLHWRSDRRIMERRCVHGVGHPDPDDVAWRRTLDPDADSVHACCGCCRALVSSSRDGNAIE